jgi:hypothetical protein
MVSALSLSDTSPSDESVSLPVESPPDSLLARGVFAAARSPPRMVSRRFCPPSGVRLRAGEGSRDGAEGIVGPRSGAMHGNVIASAVPAAATIHSSTAPHIPCNKGTTHPLLPPRYRILTLSSTIPSPSPRLRVAASLARCSILRWQTRARRGKINNAEGASAPFLGPCLVSPRLVRRYTRMRLPGIDPSGRHERPSLLPTMRCDL